MKAEKRMTGWREISKGKKNALSVCMIVKNESENLKACLESFKPVADEIIVVDTGSMDDTVSMARNFAHKVIEIDWKDDFSSARNVSLDHAVGPWVFRVDADDRLPSSQIEKIRALKKVPLDRAFSFKVIQPSKGGGHVEAMEVRMFPLDDKVRFEKPIHEEIGTALTVNDYPIFAVNVDIVHTGYTNDILKRKKAIRNLRILLRHLKTYGDDVLYLSQIGDAFSVLRASKKAVEYYRRAFENPSCSEKAPLLYRNLGIQIAQEYHKGGKFQEASLWLDRALTICPDLVIGNYLKGRAMERDGNVAEAIIFYEKAVSSSDRLDACISTDKIAKAKTTYRLGKLELECRRIERAKQWFLQAVDRYPDVIDSYFELGDIFLAEGNLDAAVYWFGKALALSRTYSPIPLIGMAKICNILNKPEQKDIFLRQLASYFPKDETARSALSSLAG